MVENLPSTAYLLAYQYLLLKAPIVKSSSFFTKYTSTEISYFILITGIDIENTVLRFAFFTEQ